jgi:hypothetical protein
MGTVLMMVTLRLLLMVFAFGGIISLEHPNGDPSSSQKFCIWVSSLMRWTLKGPDLQTSTFLQGPLGQCAPKPTTMLLGRLRSFAVKVFGSYDMSWRPTTFLGGFDAHSKTWKTSRAKVYPALFSRAIAEAHLTHAASLDVEGTEEEPQGLERALEKLASVLDPYEPYNGSTTGTMQADYHRGRGARSGSS